MIWNSLSSHKQRTLSTTQSMLVFLRVNVWTGKELNFLANICLLFLTMLREWLSLTQAYRECAHLSFDKSSCYPEKESTLLANDEEMPPATDCESSLSQSLLNLPEKKKQSIKHCAQKACPSLSAITDLTYDCKSQKCLKI